jgi:hypothetical protein
MDDTTFILQKLTEPLRTLVQSELAAGNRVVDSGAFGPRYLVRLAGEFRVKHELPPGVVYREVNDPHWWKAEYVSEKEMVVCGFGEGSGVG